MTPHAELRGSKLYAALKHDYDQCEFLKLVVPSCLLLADSRVVSTTRRSTVKKGESASSQSLDVLQC